MTQISNQDLIVASKTILTVVLSFLACMGFLHEPISIYFVLYTGTCCALMQSGSNKKDHLKSMALAGCAFVMLLALGLSVRDIVWLKDLSLIFFAFVAFYLPNWGLNYKMPPVFGVIFYVCVLEMTAPMDPMGLILLGSAFAVGIAIGVYFLFWPYRPEHELGLLSCNLVNQYRKEVYYLRQALLRKKEGIGLDPRVREDDTEKSAADTKQSKDDTKQSKTDVKLRENEKDLSTSLNYFDQLTGHASLDKKDALYFSDLYVHFYGTFQMIKMMRTTLNAFPKNPSAARLLKDLSLSLSDIETQFQARMPHSLLSKLIPKGHPPHHLLSLDEFNALLNPVLSEKNLSLAEGQFAYALLRLKEVLTEMKDRLDHWQMRRSLGLYL